MAVNPPAIPSNVPVIDTGDKNMLALSATAGFLNCIGYQNLSFSEAAAVGLTVPTGTLYAIIVVRANTATVDKSNVANYTEDNFTVPTKSVGGGTDVGMPVSNLSPLTILGTVNLNAFKIISREAFAQSARIQYYG